VFTLEQRATGSAFYPDPRTAEERLADVMRTSFPPPPVVLVVDSDADTREMLRMCLKHYGIEAAEAANAHDALQQVSESLPHAVLLDMALPGIDGYDLCRMLRERPDTHRTPIIAVTGYAYPADIQRAREAGCDAVLVKPCAPQYVLLELQRLLPSHLSSPLAAMAGTAQA
jgi:two-component system, cell cycle response regulator DivK